MKNKKNLLVTLADENYIDQAKQLFSSVYWNAGWKGDYMLLAHEIPEKKLNWFRDKGILIKKCEPFYHKEMRNYPKTILSKFYLFTPEFKRWKNIVYLDADIIVRASLDELTEIKGFAACNYGKISKMLQFSCRNVGAKNKEAIKKLKKNYNLKELGFNTGIIAFNTGIIKEQTFSGLKRLVGLYGKITDFKEQLALSLFFYKKFLPLPRTYNCWVDYMISSYNIKSQEIKGVVLHFMARNKPWLPENPFYKEWKNNLDRADFIDLKKIPKGKKQTKEEIEEYERYLKKKYSNFRSFIWKTSILIDKYIGLIGVFFKKNHPKLYFNLEKLKK